MGQDTHSVMSLSRETLKQPKGKSLLKSELYVQMPGRSIPLDCVHRTFLINFCLQKMLN